MTQKSTQQQVEDKIYAVHQNNVKIIWSTYKSNRDKAQFIDSDYPNDEWFSSLGNVLQGNRHPKGRTLRLKNTYKDKTGYDNPSQNPAVKMQKENTTMRNYGVKHILSHKELREQWEDDREQRTGYRNPSSNPIIQEEMKKAKEKGKKAFIDKISEFFINDIPISQIVKERGIPYQCAKEIFKIHGPVAFLDYCDNYEKNVSYLEQYCEKLFGCEFFNKEALENAKYRPDFWLMNNLFINVDGLYWHSEKRKGKYYHRNIREAFEQEDKRLMQFYEDEIYNKSEIIKSIVNNSLGKIDDKIMARKCKLKKCKSVESNDFFNKNHLMGQYDKTRCIGLYFNDELVSALSYRIISKKGHVEIARFGSKMNTIVNGAFSKLLKELKKITKSHGINKIISFCDLRYATGKSYEINGFKKTDVTLGFCWGQTGDEKKRFNRLQCKAYKDKDGNHVSEKEHAKQKGWFRIYDAGQAKYELIL